MLKLDGATHTASEIFQQPLVWKKSISLFAEKRNEYKGFLQEIYSKHEVVKVILTGAGTSAFIGDILAPIFKQEGKNKVFFEAVPTTDIVSNPTEYLVSEIPTILVSFARSGQSPESVATVNLGQQLIKDFYQVVITCNKDGQLAKNVQDDKNSIVILLPEEANDKSLAMTSSFSCMMLMAYALFTNNPSFDQEMNLVIENGQHLVTTVNTTVDTVLEYDFNRIIYLGSGLLGQLAHEASLKMLELTAGKVVAAFESSLGFRHGPKSILNDQSVVALFVSSDPYTRKYDLDILKEISGIPGVKVIALSEKLDETVEQYADWKIPVNTSGELVKNDFYLALLYIVFAQTLAMKKSINLGISPDNPSPDGVISRVVQGVTIYDYK
ncbi:SIS domain-containing protein [Bacillus sp. REN16]|uniref:SIS domain-containing protein n=1 Tax=Bacillus sp. REN16 TaxID=2887296 RepID=UPI001E3206A8|nr:SIS domain-containing protein [Bacillus sp. REN16]MCC3355351.1 SIS domain-containing protein [Bacillus sp. REN16]